MKKIFTLIVVILSVTFFGINFTTEASLISKQFSEIGKGKSYLGFEYAVAAGGAVTFAFIFDNQIRDFTLNYPKEGIAQNIKDVFNELGSTKTLALPAAGYITGLILNDDKLKIASLTSIETMILSGGIAVTLQALVGRERPEMKQGPYNFSPVNFNDSWNSFPSGHSTLAWALITPFAIYYDSPWLYVIPACVSAARMINDKHWASDVITGAAISYFIGYNLSKYGKDNIKFTGNGIQFDF